MKKLHVLVTGGSGMLGMDVVQQARVRGHEVFFPTREELDITNPISVAELSAGKWGGLDWVINCAAYTAVDHAETEPEQAALTNSLGPGYLGGVCRLAGCRMLHISTDYVFDGLGTHPYQEADPTQPLGVYGRTKLEGEHAAQQALPGVIISRTAWLYGVHGKCFPKSIIKAWLGGKPLRVVADQLGCPTFTKEVARVLLDLIEKDVPGGIYHAVGPETMNWHEFARLTIKTYHEIKQPGVPLPVIEAISSADWPAPALRPSYSVLSFAKTASFGIAPMRPVNEALREFCQEIDER